MEVMEPGQRAFEIYNETLDRDCPWERDTNAAIRAAWAAVEAACVPAMPEDSLPMPTTADQAALMCLLGERWLRQHAPERLKAPPQMPDDVAALVALLGLGVENYDDGDGGGPMLVEADELMAKAASAIKALVAEIERLQETVAVRMWRAANEDLDRMKAKLREAVEVMRWYAGDGSTYDGIDVGQRARAFLSTMETRDE